MLGSVNNIISQANFLASPPSKHAPVCHIPHLPGPLHRVRKRIFFYASRSVPKSCLSTESGPRTWWRHCVVLRHVHQRTGEEKGQKTESVLRRSGKESQETDGARKAPETLRRPGRLVRVLGSPWKHILKERENSLTPLWI